MFSRGGISMRTISDYIVVDGKKVTYTNRKGGRK